MSWRGCGKLQRYAPVVRSCGKSATERLLRCWSILVEWKDRSWIWQCVVPRMRKILSERQSLHDYFEREAWRALHGESIAQRKLSEPEMERDRMTWDERNYDSAAVHGINSQLESQKSELHHANQWTCQAQMESRRLFEELTTKSKLYQENHALDCMEIEELWRICHEETEKSSTVENGWYLCSRKKEKPSTMNQLLSQIRTLQGKVNALSEEREFYDPETASSSGMSHVPSQPSRIPSPRGMLSDSGLLNYTRNSVGTSGSVFGKTTWSRKNISVLTRNCHEWDMEKDWDENRKVQQCDSSNSRNSDAWNSTRRTGGTYSQNCTMETPRYAVSELHFGRFWDVDDFQCWRVNFKAEVCVSTSTLELTMS